MSLRDLDQLRVYQPPAVDFVVKTAGRCAALLRPGLGKTIVALLALLRLGVRRTLVVAPAQVVESEVWSQEAAAWGATAHLRVVELHGPPKVREMKLMLGADIFVVSYDLLFEITEIFCSSKRVRNNYFDAVLYDELSKMKHPGTIRFKRMRHWASETPVCLGLTGSPLGNHWLDIWGEMFVTAGPVLGQTIDEFQTTYFNQVWHRGAKYPTWELRQDGSAAAIKGLIRPHAFSISQRLAAAQLPEVIFEPTHFKLPPSCRIMEERLRAELEVELASGTTLYALSQSKLGQLIRQFASGAVYTNADRTEWEEVHDVKLRALHDHVDELQGEPVLVFAWFRHSKERILRDFPKFEALTGDAEQIARWNRREIDGIVVNPAGGGMGLNLQFGSSSAFWFDPEWSREKLDQGNGRLARLGQPDPFVSVRLPLVGALDRRIWDRLQEKGREEEGLIEAVALPGFY